jgi:hypothetical protein
MIPFRTYFKTFFKASEPISELQNLIQNQNKNIPQSQGMFSAAAILFDKKFY